MLDIWFHISPLVQIDLFPHHKFDLFVGFVPSKMVSLPYITLPMTLQQCSIHFVNVFLVHSLEGNVHYCLEF